jgi:AAHS family benzoate transporter-like MFS transporter
MSDINVDSGIPRRSGLLVVAICFMVVVFDGYDLLVYGSIVPSLLEEPGWDLGPAQVGAIGSYALIGMLLGAFASGFATDSIGRRKVILIGVTWFSLAMLLCAAAPSAWLLGLFRFVAGLGLGGVIPSAIALTIEYAPRGRRHLYNALMFTGYAVGGVVAAVVALAFLDDHGWRLMLVIGASPLVVVLPVAWRFLPESVGYLAARGRNAEAAALARRYGIDLAAPADERAVEPNSSGSLFAHRWLHATLLFGAASFCGLLLIYGLNTWLPQIMRQAGYPLGSALQFLLVLNVGAIVGSLLASAAADRWGPRRVVVVAFLLALVCLLLLSQRIGTLALMFAVALAGLGSMGTQILLNGYVSSYYPAQLRGRALGWTLGVGRLGAVVGPLFGGWVLAAGIGFEWNFYGFAVPALAGAILVAFVRGPAARHAPDVPRRTATPETTGT